MSILSSQWSAKTEKIQKGARDNKEIKGITAVAKITLQTANIDVLFSHKLLKLIQYLFFRILLVVKL